MALLYKYIDKGKKMEYIAVHGTVYMSDKGNILNNIYLCKQIIQSFSICKTFLRPLKTIYTGIQRYTYTTAAMQFYHTRFTGKSSPSVGSSQHCLGKMVLTEYNPFGSQL